MYRILILVAGFLIAVSGLLFLQGGDRDPRELAAVSPSLSGVEGVADMSAPANAPAAASGELDMSALSAAVSAASQPAPAPAQGDEMAALTNGILAELGVSGDAPADPAMQDLSAAVLASLNGGAAAPSQPAGQMDLSALIAQSMQSGQGDAYIDALLNEAVTTGKVQVPEAMLTADGRLDTRTFLASVVQKSMGGASDPMVAAIAAEAGAGATAPAPRVQTANGARYYTVEPGDSLAYIALMFYQDTGEYSRIFEANRDRIASPNQIRVGQRLLIPG